MSELGSQISGLSCERDQLEREADQMQRDMEEMARQLQVCCFYLNWGLGAWYRQHGTATAAWLCCS